jgi:hypothetical protein
MKAIKQAIALIFCVSTGAATAIEPYKAPDVKPYKAQGIKPVEAEGIKQFKADDIKPWQPPARTTTQAEPTPDAKHAAEVRSLLGAWQSSVSGAVWTSPSDIPGWSKLNVSPGALAGLLVIYPDGTYIWNAYGGKRGRWTPTSRSGYSIALEDHVEHKTWFVGPQNIAPDRIYIWDGNAYHYTGRRPAKAR